MQIEIPGYRIVRTLGKGGMASVYLAIQESFEREVALKVMSPELSKDAAFGERFLREARIVSRLIHPNIVTVYDVGIHEGYYFLSMEYIAGQDLTRKRFDLTLADSLNVVKDIARALDYAGVKGYVHRDVKPENIMLHDQSGRAVLMDFGIARPSDTASGMTQTGMAIGTPHYMSPEQAKGESVDVRSDLYSLGIVLFLLLTGRVPFHADSAVVVGIMHVSEEIPRLPAYLQIFQPIIDCVLAKEPLKRYQTGAELIEDLEAISAIDIADAAAQREQDQISTNNNNTNDAATFSGDSSASLSYSQAASYFPDKEKSSTMLTTKIPAFALPDDETALHTVRQTSARPEKSVPPEQKESSAAMMASNEERMDRHRYADDREERAGHGGRLFFLFLVVLTAAGFYFQAELKAWLQPYLGPVSKTIGLDTASYENHATDVSSTPLDSPPITPDVAANLALEQSNNLEKPMEPSAENPEPSAESLRSSAENLEPSAKKPEPSAGNNEVNIAESVQDLPEIAPNSSEREDAPGQGNPELSVTPKMTEEVSRDVEDSDAVEQALLTKAETQLAARQLIEPSGDNALSTYRELLAMNPGHTVARESEATIEKTLMQEIRQLMREENFLVATTRLVSAREHFPQSQALLALSAELDQAVFDKVPRVAQLAVSSAEMTSLEPQKSAIAADRIIYIGFEYRNFKAEASVIQAILFDGSRKHQIVQVPVIVSGANGTHFFRMEQPVAGFAEGGYSIDLLLYDQLLISASFSVQRP